MIYIEHKPEHYVGASISVTIHAKPSTSIEAQKLAADIELLLREINKKTNKD